MKLSSKYFDGEACRLVRSDLLLFPRSPLTLSAADVSAVRQTFEGVLGKPVLCEQNVTN